MNSTQFSRTTVVVAAAVLLAAGAAGGSWWARRSQAGPDAAAPATAGDAAAPQRGTAPPPRRILYWHDPMVPGTRFDQPGKSPFMDMDLVPVYADEAPAAGGVRVAANMVQNLGIRIGRAERLPLQRRFSAVGSVAFDERLTHVLQARVEGYVTRLHVAAPLTRVRRGAPLVEVVAPVWLEAAREYLALLGSEAAPAPALRAAARSRLTVLGVPEAEVVRLERERRLREAVTLTSPVDGVVDELGVRAGGAFMPGAMLFRLSGLSSVWVNAEIPEAQIAAVPQQVRVRARAAAWPDADFEGRVLALLPAVSAATRTLTARVALANPDGRLVPGLFVTLDFETPAGDPVLSVPSEALIRTGTRNVVIRTDGQGTFTAVNVTPGPEAAGRTTILDGLDDGDRVVLSGQFLIDSEASLQAAIDRLGGSPRPAPAPVADGADHTAHGNPAEHVHSTPEPRP